MMILVWVLALLGLVLWSLFAWGVHAVLSIDVSRLQDLKPLIDDFPYGEQIDRWVPGWQALLKLAVDAGQHLLGWVGAAAPWLAWALWLVGAGLILMVAGLGSLGVVLLRRGMRLAEAQRRDQVGAQSGGTAPRALGSDPR